MPMYNFYNRNLPLGDNYWLSEILSSAEFSTLLMIKIDNHMQEMHNLSCLNDEGLRFSCSHAEVIRKLGDWGFASNALMWNHPNLLPNSVIWDSGDYDFDF